MTGRKGSMDLLVAVSFRWATGRRPWSTRVVSDVSCHHQTPPTARQRSTLSRLGIDFLRTCFVRDREPKSDWDICGWTRMWNGLPKMPSATRRRERLGVERTCSIDRAEPWNSAEDETIDWGGPSVGQKCLELFGFGWYGDSFRNSSLFSCYCSTARVGCRVECGHFNFFLPFLIPPPLSFLFYLYQHP